jgi:hypothetical protein
MHGDILHEHPGRAIRIVSDFADGTFDITDGGRLNGSQHLGKTGANGKSQEGGEEEAESLHDSKKGPKLRWFQGTRGDLGAVPPDTRS